MIRKVEISHRTIIFTVLFLMGLWFLYEIRHIILLIFIGLIFMSALSPIVDRLEKLRIPRSLAIFLVYIIIFGGLGYSVSLLVPPLIEQSSKFIIALPESVRQIDFGFLGKFDFSIFESHLATIPQQTVKLLLGVLNNVIGIFTFMVIVYYLILERKNLSRYLMVSFGNSDKGKQIEALINRVEHKLGSWVRGQLALMIIVGLMSYIGLSFLGVKFAIPLAFLSGLLEIIPNIGPTLSAIPAILVALGSSPVLALATLALWIVIQQLENNLIVPKIMQKVVGLSPLITIISLLIGYRVAGAVGAVLSIPSVLTIEVIIKEVYNNS